MGSKLILLAAAIALSAADAAEVRVSKDGSTRFIEDFMKTADGLEEIPAVNEPWPDFNEA